MKKTLIHRTLYLSKYLSQVRNFSTMCKIKLKKKATIRKTTTVRTKPCIRGFTGHVWLNLKIKHTAERNHSLQSSVNSEGGSHICKLCGQSFSCAGNLNRHKKLHTDYKRYKCNECLQTYSNLTNFKIHIPRHHPNFGSEIKYTLTTEGAKNRPKYVERTAKK